MATTIITGASRGVGQAAAEAFAAAGYRLVLNCGSRFDQLREVGRRLSEKTECVLFEGPVGEKELKEALKIHLEDFSSDTASGKANGERIVLVNNAGISRLGLVQEMQEEDFREMLEVNLGVMFRTTRAVIPYLLHTGNGAIVNVSSVWGVAGASMETLYSMTKGGVNAFTQALAKELAPSHIPVNAIALGAVDTDMNRWLTQEERKSLEEEIPYGRMASPEEAGEAILRLSEMPAYLTGQIIRFDGGWI